MTQNSNLFVSQAIHSVPIESRSELLKVLCEQGSYLVKVLQAKGFQVQLSANPFQKILESEFDLKLGLEILNNLNTRIEILKAAIDQDIDLNDNKGLFWLACRRFGFRPQSDFLEIIESDDVLEIYTLDGKQVFSNFFFWSLTSYPIDVILSHAFLSLFHRESIFNDQILKAFEWTCIHSKTREYAIKKHMMQEIFLDNSRKFEIQFRSLSPLHLNGSLSAVASLLKAKRSFDKPSETTH